MCEKQTRNCAGAPRDVGPLRPGAGNVIEAHDKGVSGGACTDSVIESGGWEDA